MKFIKLTGIDEGKHAYINVNKIAALSETRSLDGKSVYTYVSLENGDICEVKESVEDIVEMLRMVQKVLVIG